ncbi:MAG: NADH:flavin oxidoreductase [Pirellulales bacterium]|nr:NADH:flavin oxidoreductase [Pirellulales bacterium]
MFPKISHLKSIAAFRARLAALGLELPSDDAPLSAAEGSPLAAPLNVASRVIGNRWCIQPMEGWDCQLDGAPSELTLRRWRHFGSSGAKLIWGGEAAAVRHDGRANPNQLLATADHRAGLATLLTELRDAHQLAYRRTDDLLVGLQLTHSGRYARPNGTRLEPRIAYHHPLLDARTGIDANDDSVVWTDAELEQLIERFVAAAGVAHDVGFDFVDVKACHGYLLHEFLSARDRPGPFGGDLAGRSRLLCEIVSRVSETYPDLLVGVRLSALDTVPFEEPRHHLDDEHDAARGQPMPFAHLLPYRWAFGAALNDPLRVDLTETIELLQWLFALGVRLFNISAGSPYYNPHVQRPAWYPPSDGYPPPEDPLVGVCRQIETTRACKQALPNAVVVGSGYSYLQEYLPHVAQAVVRAGWVDSVGLGRMVLAYPEFPADVLAGRPLTRPRICRTFSDCTTGPRKGLVSGCYPLDAYYKQLPAATALRDAKRAKR